MPHLKGQDTSFQKRDGKGFCANLSAEGQSSLNWGDLLKWEKAT